MCGFAYNLTSLIVYLMGGLMLGELAFGAALWPPGSSASSPGLSAQGLAGGRAPERALCWPTQMEGSRALAAGPEQKEV